MVAEKLENYIFCYIKFFFFKGIYLCLIKVYLCSLCFLYYYSKNIFVFNQNILILNNEIYIQYFFHPTKIIMD